MTSRVALVILAGFLAATAVRAEAPDIDALRRAAIEAEDARFHRTVELADLREREGKLDEAKGLYGEALALRPDDADVMDALLDVLRRTRDFAAQIPLYDRLCARRPGDAPLAFDAGECLWRLGRTAEAKRAWEELLRRFPADRPTYDRLVDFYAAEGLVADARAALEERRRRFGDEPGLRLVEARLALAEKKPDAAVAALLAALDDDLDDADRDRAETLLLAAAADSHRTDEVAKKLAESVARADARVADRLLDLARQAADAENFPAAISLAERAIPHLKDHDAQVKTILQIGVWKSVE